MAFIVEVLRDEKALHERAARLFASLARKASKAGRTFSVALSGGSTPKGLYALLSDPRRPYRKRIPWESIHFFWGDERFVSPGDPESNFGSAYAALLAQVPVPPSHIHRVPTEAPSARLAASLYEKELRAHFRPPQGLPKGLPRFDLVFLGLGPEGHTASLFPASPALREKRRLVAAPWVEQKKTRRITLTLPVLNQARNVVFLVSGKTKARITRLVLGPEGRLSRAPRDGRDSLPASLIRPGRRSLLWLLDRPAASRLRD